MTIDNGNLNLRITMQDYIALTNICGYAFYETINFKGTDVTN